MIYIFFGSLTNLVETTLRPPRDEKGGKARVLKVNEFNNFSSSPSSLLEVIKATSQDQSKNLYFLSQDGNTIFL